jgi:Leucine-rich repeat (LRR) protein
MVSQKKTDPKQNAEPEPVQPVGTIGRIRGAVSGTRAAIGAVRNFVSDKAKEIEVGQYTVEKLIEHAVANHYFHFEHIGLKSIPEELFESKELRRELEVLFLQHNSILEIPPEICQLSNLRCVNLSHNQISQIPYELMLLNSLVGLDMSSNKISAIPEKLYSRMSQLMLLSLNNNTITTISDNIQLMTSLTQLDLGGNQLRTIPPTISNLTLLTQLDLRDNNINLVPTEIEKLINLKKFYLQRNRLKTLPKKEHLCSFHTLTKLEVLDISHNKLQERDLRGLDHLTNLDALLIASNRVIGIPFRAEHALQMNCSHVNAAHNQIEEFPSRITNMSETLTDLDLRSNMLHSLTNEIKHLVNLKTLNCSHNKITFLPQELSYCTALVSIRMSHNCIRNMHPSSFNNTMVNLKELMLDHNEIVSLPDAVTELSGLMTLKVQYNHLKSLPSELYKIPYLYSIHASHNRISEIPEDIGDCPKLRKLYLDHNRIAEVPETLKNLSSLQFLNLKNNLIELPKIEKQPEVVPEEKVPTSEKSEKERSLPSTPEKSTGNIGDLETEPVAIERTIDDVLRLPSNEHVVCKVQ